MKLMFVFVIFHSSVSAGARETEGGEEEICRASEAVEQTARGYGV